MNHWSLHYVLNDLDFDTLTIRDAVEILDGWRIKPRSAGTCDACGQQLPRRKR